MRILVPAFILWVVTSSVQAQAGPPLSIGQRVWVRSPGASGGMNAGIKGTLEGRTGDSLQLRLKGEGAQLVSVGLGGRNQLFVFAGRRSSAGKGAAIGGIGGALAGAILGLATGSDCSADEFLCFDRGTMAAVGAIGVGGIGLVGGLIVGLLSPHDTWVRAEWSGSVRPVVTPSPRGVGLGLSLSF
jgi:hypothetical protein